jgi:hypothetical protein
MTWLRHPLSLIAAAMSTAAGAVVTVVSALGIGTLLANFALRGDWMKWWECLWGGLLVVAWACMAVWGFLYVGVLMWVLHRLVYGEASRPLFFGPLVLAQYTVTILISIMMHEGPSRGYHGSVTRTIVVFAILAGAVVVSLLLKWQLIRRARVCRGPAPC